MPDLTKATFKNADSGPRGVWGIDPETGNHELHMLEPGKQRTLQVSAVELEDQRDNGYFTITGPDDDDEDDDLPALGAMNKAQLLDQAKAEGVEIEDGATKADILAAIELAREAAPGT